MKLPLLTCRLQKQVLQNIIKPYRCVSLDFLAKEINVANEEAPVQRCTRLLKTSRGHKLRRW